MRTQWLRWILVCAAALVLAGTAAASDTPDAWITTKVKMNLIGSSEVGGMKLNVDTNDGRVTLSGKVESNDEKAAAGRIATNTRGVTGVRNLLQVVPKGEVRKQVNKTDDQIKDAVDNAIDREPALKNSGINVKSVNKGVVLLSGKAESLSDHLLAMEIANDVPGTRKVVSEIKSPDNYGDREVWGDDDHHHDNSDDNLNNNRTTDNDKNRTTDNDKDRAADNNDHGNRVNDAWITARTKLSYMTDSAVPAGDINVDTRHGVVTLFGTVPTSEAKAKAQETAQRVSGVREVNDELTVLGRERNSQDTRADGDIASDVKKRLSDAHFHDASIDVDVKGMAVKLSGTVSNYQDEHEAIAIAYRTRGVQKVVSDIRLDEKAAEKASGNR